MDSFVLLFLLCVCFIIFVFIMLRAQIPRIFTENYTELKKKFPKPLYTWRFLSGYLSTKSIMPFRFRGMLKIDAYSDMLIVSVRGKSVFIGYDQYVLRQNKTLFGYYLIVVNLPVQSGNTFFKSPIDFGETTNLNIFLSASKIDKIMNLVQSSKNHQA